MAHDPDKRRPAGAGDGGREAARPGRIAAVFADRCLVWSAGEEVVCALRGRFKGRTKPVVGDRVDMVRNADGSGTVTAVQPRSSALTRTVADRKRLTKPSEPQVLAANVELLVMVAAVARPPLRPGLLDRFLVAAARARIAPLLCINKLDLDPGDVFEAVEETYAPLRIPVVGTTLERPETLAPLAEALAGRTSVLVGHSGVGKTSLLNALAGREMATREVGFHRDRGRHTTSTARLIPLEQGGFAIDSPGVREFGLHGITAGELAHYYPDFAPYLGGCRFADCLHREEPGCAVWEGVEAGEIDETRYINYRKLVEEML